MSDYDDWKTRAPEDDRAPLDPDAGGPCEECGDWHIWEELEADTGLCDRCREGREARAEAEKAQEDPADE